VKACFERKISPMAPASILRCHPNATAYLATNSALQLGPELQAPLRADTGDGDPVTIQWTSSNASTAGACVNVFSWILSPGQYKISYPRAADSPKFNTMTHR
jgi:hypothetical protein